MKKSTRWILFFLVLSFFFLLAVGMVLGVYFFSRPGGVIRPSGKQILTFNVPPSISELPMPPGLSSMFRPRPLTLFETTEAIREAARDDGISSIYMNIKFLTMGWSQVQELRDALQIFRDSGKPIYTYLEMSTNREYYLCSGSDEIHMPPETIVQLGLLSETTFFRRTLEKVKVEPQLEHIGKYKSASDILTRDSMSEAHRDSTNSMLDSIYGQLVSGIADSRHIESASVESIIDKGLLSPTQMLDAGLIDSISYPDQLKRDLNLTDDDKSNRISLYNYAQGNGIGIHFGPKIAVIFAEGEITGGRSSNDGWANIIGSDSLSKQLRKVREDDDVAAVVLRINSPGGSGFASDLIWREVELTKQEKPVIVSMSDLAASGGYYIAMGADYIFAQPGTLTGSIGVIAGKFVLSDLYDWAGMSIETIKRGENSDFFTSSQGFSDTQRERLHQHMQEFYDTFVQKAADGRGMTFDEVHELAQGRVWTGEQAVAFGLADELGGLRQAIDKAKDLAGLPPKKKVNLDIYPRERTFFEQLQGVDQVHVAATDFPEPVTMLMKEADRAERFKNEPVLLLMSDIPDIR